MISDNFTSKILIGLAVIAAAAAGFHYMSQPKVVPTKVPNGVYVSSDGTYLYDFQTGGTGRSEFYLPATRGGMRLDESTPFIWQISEDLIYLDLNNAEKSGCAMKWDNEDLIIQGSYTRIIKK